MADLSVALRLQNDNLSLVHSAPDALSCHPMAAAVLNLSDNMVLHEAVTKV